MRTHADTLCKRDLGGMQKSIIVYVFLKYLGQILTLFSKSNNSHLFPGLYAALTIP
jgi:hypothetical protein